MKRILTILCALAIVLAGSVTALAAEDTGQSASYYPISPLPRRSSPLSPEVEGRKWRGLSAPAIEPYKREA